MTAASATATAGDPSAKPKDPNAKKLFPLRKRTGTAAFHMSTRAVDIGHAELGQLTELQAVLLMAEANWGSTTYMPCPHCGTLDKHYWTLKELRWKCKCCDKRFSVTSGTVFADHKLPLTKLIGMVFSWVNGSSGKPALQLRRDWKVSYPTAFTLAHKLREGLLRGFNVGILAGVHEMDGADMNGRRYREKRNVPQGGGKSAQKPSIPAHLLNKEVDPETGEIKDVEKGIPPKEFVGPPKPPKFDKRSRMPADRRLLLVIRQRSVSKGKGAVATRVAVALSESSTTVTTMATRFASAESEFRSDEDPAYAQFKKLFADHKTVSHSETFSLPGGVNNNQAESFNWRMRRLVEGIYLSPSNKYLTDYAAEAAWREDTRKLSTGKRLCHVFSVALRVGLSQWWRGYTHGNHRDVELLVEGEQEVTKNRGKKKGWKAKLPR